MCQVSKAGDDQYTMNKKKVHRKYITNLAKAYGIETGNLCQFLAQDTVREFPELSPQMIFKGKGLSLNSVTTLGGRGINDLVTTVLKSVTIGGVNKINLIANSDFNDFASTILIITWLIVVYQVCESCLTDGRK